MSSQYTVQVVNRQGQLYDRTHLVHCFVPENIHTPPTEGFLVSKKRGFENPLPLGISINLP